MVRVTIPITELRFETSRSGGPGGQNVNKLETKVRLFWDFKSSSALTLRQIEMLIASPDISRRLNSEGELTILCQTHRTQAMNRDEAVNKLHDLLAAVLKPKRKRVPTKVTKASKERRITAKKKRGFNKSSRRVRE